MTWLALFLVAYFAVGLLVLNWLSHKLDGKSVFHGDLPAGGILMLVLFWPTLVGIVMIAYTVLAFVMLAEWASKKVFQ